MLVPQSSPDPAERARVLEEIFRAAPSFLVVVRGPDFRLELVNDAYRELVGRPAFDAAPESADGLQAYVARVLTTGEPFVGHELPITVTRAPGAPPEVRIVDLVCLPLVDRDGSRTRVLGYGTDVTDHVAARRVAESAERARGEGERTRLRRQLAEAEEAERRRIARELHDQLGQHLTAITWGLGEAKRLTLADADAQSRLAERLGQLQELAGAMSRDARYLALELRPAELDDVGLESALATYVEQWSARYGVQADVAIAGVAERRIPAEAGIALYRIAQEALTNVARHAAARQVSVIVEKPDGEIRLIVEDDGRGFDVEATLARARVERRLGLAGIRERAALAGGTATVESTPGRGTTIYVRLLVAADEPATADGAG